MTGPEKQISRSFLLYAIIKKDMNETLTKKDLKEALDSLTINLCKRMDDRFDLVDQRFNGIDSRFDRIEEQIEDLALMTKVQFDEVDRT